MNDNNIMISTLPIKPQKNTNIGMMIAPTIMDFMGTVLNIEKNIGFNVLSMILFLLINIIVMNF